MLCLAITGFAGDPEQVTELLQTPPTVVARKGTPSLSGRPHRSNGWWLVVHADEPIDGTRHAAALNHLI